MVEVIGGVLAAMRDIGSNTTLYRMLSLLTV